MKRSRARSARRAGGALVQSLFNQASFYLPLDDAGSGAVNTVPAIALGSPTPTSSRATTAYTWTRTGVMVQVGAGVLRSAYTPTGIYLGYLSELAATQLVTPTAAIKDMTGWANAGTMTVALTATDTLGNANACSRLTGGAVAATNRLTLTLAAAASSRTYSCYIRRITGTGPILLTQDNFATTSDVSSTLTANQWVLCQYNANVLNAQYGIQVSTPGDVIDVDWNLFEAGNEATSPIDTAGGTRNADVLSYATTGNVDFATGSGYAEISRTSNGSSLVCTYVGINTARILAINAGAPTSITVFDSTNQAFKVGLTSCFNVARKRASSWGAAGQSVGGDGVAVGTSVFDGSMGSGATIGIGHNSGGITQINGTIKNVRLWTRQLTDAELVLMTA